MGGSTADRRPRADTAVDVSDGVATAVRVLATLLVVGVLLQPVSAGGYLGNVGSWGLTAHEIGANATFGVALLEGAVVMATPLRHVRRLIAGLVAMGVALTAIIGLGYVGGGALVVHVPLAVVAAIGATHHLTTVRRTLG